MLKIILRSCYFEQFRANINLNGTHYTIYFQINHIFEYYQLEEFLDSPNKNERKKRNMKMRCTIR